MPDQSDKYRLLKLAGSLFSTRLTPLGSRRTLPLEDAAIIERYKLLTENLAAAVVLRDAGGRVIYCSPFTEVLTGHPLAAILSHDGDFFESTVHEKDREHYARAMKVSRCGEAFQFRYRFYHKSGLEMWAETRTVPVLDSSSEESFPSLSITLDVTGTVLYQRQVEERNRDLQDFTYMVTHDLKAPVYTLKGMIGIFEEDFQKQMTSEQREVLDHMHKATARLEELIGGVLEYSRISAEEVSLEPVDLGAVLGEVMSDLSGQIKETNASVEVRSPMPAVLGDRMKLYRIFSNLVGNALKYRSPERAPHVVIREIESSLPRRVVIGVEDNGCGIPEDKLEIIFRPFHRVTPGNVEGTGIGLASVRRLIDKLGGEVEAQSELGKGSTFFVTLKRP